MSGPAADPDRAGEAPAATPGLPAQARLWAQKWRWYERNSLPWNRARIHWELMRRGAFARWPLHGNVLEAMRQGLRACGSGRARSSTRA